MSKAPFVLFRLRSSWMHYLRFQQKIIWHLDAIYGARYRRCLNVWISSFIIDMSAYLAPTLSKYSCQNYGWLIKLLHQICPAHSKTILAVLRRQASILHHWRGRPEAWPPARQVKHVAWLFVDIGQIKQILMFSNWRTFASKCRVHHDQTIGWLFKRSAVCSTNACFYLTALSHPKNSWQTTDSDRQCWGCLQLTVPLATGSTIWRINTLPFSK